VYAAGEHGERLVFGSSGFLYRSNKLMYDRGTNSLWHAITGEPVVGALAHSGIRLRQLPVVVSTWGQWRAAHPGTKVLSLETGHVRDYRPNAAYGRYYASPDTMFPAEPRSAALPPKAFVYALTLGGTPKAYPLEVLDRERVVNDTVGATAVVLVAEGRGRTVRAYRRGERTFRPADDGALVDDRGARWRVTEDALVQGDARLERLPGHIAYWFGWYAFNPRTLLYGR
jgi:hypothetical protein